MNYRTLGRTGLRVSEIGFGCGNVGGMLVRGSHEEQIEAVQRALDLGINYFDTASSYGDGLSETHLGEVLAELRPDVRVATKFRIRNEDMSDIRGAVQRSIEESLTRLGRDSADVLQLHTQITEERGAGGRETVGVADVLGSGGVADALDTVRSQGLIRFTGFTGMGDTSALHKVVDSGRFDTVQAYYNLLNPSAGTAVQEGYAGQDFQRLMDRASERGMGVVVIRVMAGGALGGPAARTDHASPTVGGAMVPGGEYDADDARARKLEFLTAGDVSSLPQAAVCFALGHAGASTVLVGFSDVVQVEEATACSGKSSLPETAMERLRGLWATDFWSG